MTPTEQLEQIERGIQAIQTSQGELDEAREKDVADRKAIHKLIEKQDERLKSSEEALHTIEKAVEKARFGGSGDLHEIDSLRNALPDRVKRQICGLSASAGFRILKAKSGGSPLADPVIVAAGLGWMQAKINAVMATSKGNPMLAGKWAEEASKISEVLDKLAPARVVKADLQEDVAAEGGDLIPTVTEAVIGWLVKEASVVRQAGPTVVQMATKTHNLPTLANDFSVAWISEEGVATDSAPATPFGSGALTANKQSGLVTISNELIQDNIVNLMDFVMTHLSQQIGRAEDIQVLEGTGSPFSGLFSVAGVNSVAGGTNALSFDEIVKLIYGGEHQSTMDGGVIFCHPFIIRDALQLTTGATGAPWLVTPSIPSQAAGAARPKNLLGVNTFPTSSILRNRGAGTNETTAYHGNPRYIVIGDRLGTTFVVNPWGGSGGEFEKDQVKLRLTRRVGVLIWVPAYFTKLTAVTV